MFTVVPHLMSSAHLAESSPEVTQFPIPGCNPFCMPTPMCGEPGVPLWLSLDPMYLTQNDLKEDTRAKQSHFFRN